MARLIRSCISLLSNHCFRPFIESPFHAKICALTGADHALLTFLSASAVEFAAAYALGYLRPDDRLGSAVGMRKKGGKARPAGLQDIGLSTG